MRKRLIYRCDDVGYTETYDLGIFKVFDAGIGCSADIMFDAEHARQALEKVKERPWLSVGWHRHLWERPVLPAEEVPSLVNQQGRFKWGHRHNELMLEATYEDAYREFKAEMELCYSVLGKYPDVAGTRAADIPLEKAFKDVCDECGIVTNYFINAHNHRPGAVRGNRPVIQAAVDDKWAEKNIISLPIQVGHQFDMRYIDEYKPIIPMTNITWTDKEEIYFYGWHPGFTDLHIWQESTCNIHRVIEHEAAVSEAYRNWIRENKVELINFRDALYGTNEMQDHLKEINSDLWIGNM